MYQKYYAVKTTTKKFDKMYRVHVQVRFLIMYSYYSTRRMSIENTTGLQWALFDHKIVNKMPSLTNLTPLNFWNLYVYSLIETHQIIHSTHYDYNPKSRTKTNNQQNETLDHTKKKLTKKKTHQNPN